MKDHAGSKPVSVEAATSLNLVPMVDIMFLMLLFFMLGSDMGQRELEDVVLPVASTVRPDKSDDENPRTTVNVFHFLRRGAHCSAHASMFDDSTGNDAICRDDTHWRVGIRGHDYDPKDPEQLDQLSGLLKRDADENMTETGPEAKSDRLVMIRGDLAAPYGAVQQVMHICSKVRIYKIEVGAAAPNPSK